ncbi:DnaB-like helicase C-terminal domain-containing protein [Xanthobacter sp. YC-JY1]|uniref:DnaB-like helicase C-terminal domain-containing protein n=1 Tax=Xanthobacter sp. YC-JY1 TaxID=2419844 RepID=UPI001F413C09|nr:DnaB-like helicase C-terminal domain-containing protein [Xanthobacter sp. YC-JY1]UJX45772.1 DNA primase [Xanthobacter sp. YC-JY1]
MAPTERETKPKMKGLLPVGEAQDLPKRHLVEETCRRAGYTVSEMGGELVQVANYRDETGAIVAQKVRGRGKEFKFLGDTKSAGLYLQHLWRDGGKRVIVTEGEIDALTVFQELAYRWPVVSLPNGAQGAKKSLSNNLEWLLKFEHIDLCFDQDDPGRAATEECLGLFPPGRARIIKLPLKDPNAMLQEGRRKELIDALWSPAEFRPDGIVTLDDLAEQALADPEAGLPWCFPSLNDGKTFGRRYGEAVALGAGTGIGKSDFMSQQIAFDIVDLGLKVGVFAFEQQPVETVKRVAGKHAGRTFHVPDGSWTKPELKTAIGDLQRFGGLFLYDHFGACDWDVVSTRIRYLRHSHGVRVFYIDHLTALAGHGDEERGSLEKIMAELGGLVKELDIWVLFVSHLSTPEGKPHEEGGRVTIKQFKGSRAIGYWSHFMFGMERNTQADDEEERKVTTFRVLKDRYTGRANGFTLPLHYAQDTGRLFEGAERGFDASTDDF